MNLVRALASLAAVFGAFLAKFAVTARGRGREVLKALRRKGLALRALVFAACGLALLLAADTHRSAVAEIQSEYRLPRLRFEYGAEVTPDQAAAYFSNAPNHIDTFTYRWAAEGRPPEIAELAEALNHDPFLIFRYVQETTDYVPTYGVSKGAMGVVIDRSGNAFDHAAFLAEILAEARQARPSMIGEIQIKVGYLTLSSDEVNAWLGVSGDQQIRDLFRSGGVPVSSNGGSYQVGHAWVEVVLDYGGGDARNGRYVLDAALKVVDRPQGLMDLPGAARDFTGISAGQNVVDNVKIYSSAVAAQIASSTYVQMSPDQILGEDGIVPANFWIRRSGETDGCGPGYSATDCLLRNVERAEVISFGGMNPRVPDEYRTRVHLCASGALALNNTACAAADHIEAFLFADEIYGRRLGLEPFIDGSAPGSYRLVLDNQVISTLNTTSGATGAIRIEVNHPYPAASPGSPQAGSFADAAHDFPFAGHTSVVLLLGFGDAGQGLVGKLGERANFFDAKYPGRYTITSGETAKNAVAARWLTQTSRMSRLHTATNGVRTLQHHWAGVVFSTWGDINPTPRLEAVNVSVAGMASAVVVDGSSGPARTRSRHAGEMTYAAAANTLEGSVGEQSFDTPLSSSVPRAWGSRADENPCGAGSDYNLVTPENYETVRPPYCTNYLGDWTRVDGELPIGWRYAAAGYRVVSSNIAQHGPFPYAKLGVTPRELWGTIGQRHAAYVAYRQAEEESEIAFVAGGSKGGSGASDQRTNLLETLSILQDEFRDRSVYNGVDLRTGDFTYTAAPDIVIGDGEFPHQLAVQRQYRADDTRCINCPYGWTHNWDIEVLIFSDGLEAMGARTHQLMHSSIAALRTAFLIYRDDTRTEIARQVDGAKVLDWWRINFILNVAAYRRGHTRELYLRTEPSRFVGPPGHLCDSTDQPCDEIFDEDGATIRTDRGGTNHPTTTSPMTHIGNLAHGSSRGALLAAKFRDLSWRGPSDATISIYPVRTRRMAEPE